MLDFFENLFEQIDPLTAYMVLLVSAFTENVLPPIPGDTVVVLGAYLVSIEKLNFWGVYLSTTFGSVAGFGTMFFIARHFGKALLYKKASARLFKETRIEKAQRWFSKWGYWVIFANRFLSGTRSVISIFAGIFHLNSVIVLLLALLSASIWNALLISGGLLLGKNWHIIADFIVRYNQIVFLLILGIIAYLVTRKYIFKRRSLK
jgi:membrane protein DedA with SNARE-associated domain